MTSADGDGAPVAPEEGAALWRGVAVIIGLGIALGVAQNALMRHGENLAHLKDYQRRSLAWIREHQVLDQVADGSQAPPPDGGTPVAAAQAGHAAEPPEAPPEGNGDVAAPLPFIPDTGQPMDIQLALVKRFVDRDAAAIVDARPSDQFAEGHILGAVNLPFDEAVTDPARLETFDAKGRPIIIYCGGGNCETSRNLAFAMIQAGQKRLLIFTGGFPEWSAAGYPVATVAAPGTRS